MSLKDNLDDYKGLTLSNDEWFDQRSNMKKDVKEAVLHFKSFLNTIIVDKNDMDLIIEHYDEVFGDFEK